MQSGQGRTIEDLHGEQDEDVEADNPGDGDADTNPDPKAVLPEVVLRQDGIHEGVAWLTWCWLLPPFCTAIQGMLKAVGT